MGGHTLWPAQHHPAVVDDAQLRDRLANIGDVFALIIEIKNLAGQRKLRQPLRRHWLGIIQQREHFGAAVHAVNRTRLDWQQVPHDAADRGGFVIQHLGEHRFAGFGERQSDFAAVHARNVRKRIGKEVLTQRR